MRELSGPIVVPDLWIVTMAGSSAAKASGNKTNVGDERLFDRELEDLPVELHWREWMLRVEAVIFASAEPMRRWRRWLARIGALIC